ncbi:MAG: rhodanese-like domain-containing protein [Flavobacteriaceae bacterium]|nr:rhodanese-like domain-containing protein [Flavobacteriaceae bacterium]
MSFFGVFGSDKENDQIELYLKEGAVIIDVRTVAEFDSGHVSGSENIVLDTIPDNIASIKAMNKKVIACCKSGGRSGQAMDFLKASGVDCINGGPWQNVDKFVK